MAGKRKSECDQAWDLLLKLNKRWSDQTAKALSEKVAYLRRTQPELVKNGSLAALQTEYQIILSRRFPSRPQVIHLKHQKKKKPIRIIDRKRPRRN